MLVVDQRPQRCQRRGLKLAVTSSHEVLAAPEQSEQTGNDYSLHGEKRGVSLSGLGRGLPLVSTRAESGSRGEPILAQARRPLRNEARGRELAGDSNRGGVNSER